ncbi:hypothetical protein AAFF_G00031400 [Aldrovandia affinis]|uniref:B-cell receptor CD22 n=1 Tax=Aldrovandia affinis TaxID=143900 RepID=A0AAD7R4D8_9TELE|nr:hypothetical protein AAFF_G00031400 [Aldrovandia affinis]
MLLQRYIIFVVLSLTVQGVLGQDGWSVSYRHVRICALKGSSVDMPCTYSYPNDNTVETTFWFVEKTVDLAETPEYKGRVEYRGNKEHDCTLRVRGLRESDSKTYFFRFITNRDQYYGQGGSTLSVTDLQVEVNPATVTEGQSVTLTCRTTCTLSGSPAFICVRYAPKSTSVSVSPSGEIVEGGSVTLTCSSNANPPVQRYTWFKNSRAITSWRGSGQSYTIKDIKPSDSGEYYCEAVNGVGSGSSHSKHLNVQYAPKSTSVSVSPSGEIVEGGSVTLTCSSNANPPVQRYTWFKNSRAITSWRGSEQSYTIKDIKPSDSGEYYCEAVNRIGERLSPHILLNVQYPPKSTSVSVSPSGEIVEGGSVTLTCSSNANPPVQRYTWFKNSRAIPSWRGSEQSYTIKDIKPSDSGEYYCEAVNGVGSGLSHSKHLNVQYAPKSTSVSVSPSGEIVEGGSVTLTCSSNANPPVQRYTWFKKNDTGVWQTGSGQSLNTSNFRSWNSGQYYCEAENKHGVHNSTALSITTKGERSLMVAICASAGITALVTLVLVAVTVWMCKRKKGGTPRARERGADTQACPNPDNDTYTALNLNDVSSDYDTLTACPNPDNDTYTALNRNDVSSDYDTLTSLRNAPASVYH